MDPPEHNSRMVVKLMLPFPLLSDPRGDLIRRLGLWDENEGVSVPSILVVDRSDEIRYHYTGSDFADRPGDEEIFATLDALDAEIGRITGGPEIMVTAEEARESVRPNKQPLGMEELLVYHRGVYRTTVALKKRFASWGRPGREALREVGRYQAMVQKYREALAQTVELKKDEEV